LEILQLAVEEIEVAPAVEDIEVAPVIIARSLCVDAALKVRFESHTQAGRLAAVHASHPRVGAIVDDGSIPRSVGMDCRKATNGFLTFFI
jgi:hypothetical protein